MLIPPWYVSSISERLALYNELAAVNSENGLRTFSDNLRDRFGKLPDEVISLMDTVRLKWAGKEIGLEKITLGRGGMKLFFPADPSHPLFASDRFQRMLQYVAGKPEKFSVRQTEKMLFLQVRLVEDLHQALFVLEEMSRAAKA
jgi:transcription-repair coupling factor (superfamily II helicase)